MLKLDGLKTTFISLAATGVVFAVLIHFQAFWQSKLPLISILVYPLLIITALFAAQFNHSRVALLCALLGLFQATSAYSLPWSAWLLSHQSWLILAGVGILVLLALVKDRGLFSIHGVTRVLLIALVGAGAFGWLQLCELFNQILPQYPFGTTALPYLPLLLPIGLSALVLLWRSLRQNNITLAALLASFLVWYLNHYQLIELPWAIVITVLSTLYLLAVSIDSYFLAYRDDLTGLPTRRALTHLALSLGRKYTVAMLDIDHFKKFNDTYGHDIGDQVLKLVAAKLATVKNGGKVFRYGGEEFTVVFARKTAEQATVELERLRQTIANYAMIVRQPQRSNKKARQKSKPNAQTSVNVTVSIGVAQRAAKQSFEVVLKNADLALYRAKKNGRNNVSL